ncbi:MAG: outer membrane beta-barrel protein [Cyanobacteria bacterium P01_F01_bin.33]
MFGPLRRKWPLAAIVLAGVVGQADIAIAQSFADSEPGFDEDIEQLQEGFADEPDIGAIEFVTSQPEPSIFRFLIGVEYRGTDNVNFENFVTSPDADGIFLGNIGFVAAPAIADRARLVASISAGIARFSDQTDLDFNRINGSVGIHWDLKPTFLRMAIQAQNINRTTDGFDDFDDIALQFQLGQTREFQYDTFPRPTTVSYYYQLRASFAEPESLSQVSNSFNVSVRHPITPRLQGRLGYRLSLNSYAEVDRADTRNRVSGELRYALSRDVKLRGFVTYTNNESNNDIFQFDALSYGIGIQAGFSI